MDGEFIRKRLSDLQIQKGVSEYKMSLDLGHSKGYVQSISSGRAMPSMAEFLYICDYFGISPGEFFNTESEQPALTAELAQKSSRLLLLSTMLRTPEKMDLPTKNIIL